MTENERNTEELAKKSNGGAFTPETAALAGKKSSRKGVPNVQTAESREMVKMIVDGNWKKLYDELSKLEGKDYVNSILKLLEFHLPKLNKVEMKDNNDDSRLTITVNYSEDDLQSDEMR